MKKLECSILSESDIYKLIHSLFPNLIIMNIQQQTEGITNKLYLVKLRKKRKLFRLLVRVYGKNTDLIIDRNREIENIQKLSQLGLAPPIYALFQNGIVYGFVPGRTIELKEMKEKGKEIAKCLKYWHESIPNHDNHQSQVWKTCQQWLQQVSNDLEIETKNGLLKKQDILTELQFMKNECQMKEDKIVFCHNDLLSANIIYQPADLLSQVDIMDSPTMTRTFSHSDISLIEYSLLPPPSIPMKETIEEEEDDQQQVNGNNENHLKEDENLPLDFQSGRKFTFIDYEYGDWNHAAFDIANHFNEFAGFKCDYSTLYPSPNYQKQWLRWYLEEDGHMPTEQEVLKLFEEVKIFGLVSHLYWGIWALVQHTVSDIDFDYLKYAGLRFEEYYRKKQEIFS